MKKTLSVVTALLSALLLLAGCSTETAQNNSEPPAASETELQTEKTEVRSDEDEPEESAQTEIDSSALQQLGEIDPLNDISDCKFSDSGLMRSEIQDDHRKYVILDVFGVDNLGETYDDVNAVEPGLYKVVQANDTPNCCGLVSEDGTVYIPCEAAIITPLNDRYFAVSYATEETENEEEALLYTTDRWFSLSAAEGDVLYKGYTRVFDLEISAFVPNVEISSPSERLTGFGKLLLKETQDRTYEVYDAEGTLLTTWDSYAVVSTGAAVADFTEWNYVQHDGVVYDDDLNAIVSYDQGSVLTHGDEFFFTKKEDGQITVMDEQGDAILSETAVSVSLVDEFFDVCVGTSDGQYGYELWSLQGEKLSENVSSNFTESNRYGYLYSETEENVYTLIYPDGSSVENLQYGDMLSKQDLCIAKIGDDSSDVFVVDQKDFSLNVKGEAAYLMPGLVTGENSLGKLAIFDYITGKQLTDYLYSEIKVAGSHIYCLGITTWSVYDYIDA